MAANGACFYTRICTWFNRVKVVRGGMMSDDGGRGGLPARSFKRGWYGMATIDNILQTTRVCSVTALEKKPCKCNAVLVEQLVCVAVI